MWDQAVASDQEADVRVQVGGLLMGHIGCCCLLPLCTNHGSLQFNIMYEHALIPFIASCWYKSRLVANHHHGDFYVRASDGHGNFSSATVLFQDHDMT
eukprot:6016683-Amphidinium_carterae.1